MSKVRTFFHWLAHIAQTNTGVIECWHDNGVLMVGFRCDCGRLDGVHKAHLPELGAKQ